MNHVVAPSSAMTIAAKAIVRARGNAGTRTGFDTSAGAVTAGAATAEAGGTAASTSLTGAMNLYPRVATVSIYRDSRASSPIALRSCAIARVRTFGVTN